MNHEHEYDIHDAGRVKAAGVPFDTLTEPAAVFVQAGTPAAAAEMAGAFVSLRHAPPEELRDRIFPRNRGTKDQFRSGALLTRPILKTDQGAGQFLSFTAGNGRESLAYTIATQTGYCIVEPFFQAQLAAVGYPEAVGTELAAVKDHFAVGELHEAQLAYERLQLAAETAGISTAREAAVGRDALFFIRPSLPEAAIRIPQQALEQTRQIIRATADRFAGLAAESRARFAKAFGVEVHRAPYYPPLYFQADLQLLPDGSGVLDQVHLPDVGLFLTTLDPEGNTALAQVQAATRPLAEAVVDRIAVSAQGAGVRQVFFLTRDEVMNGAEDVLEQREMQAMAGLLAERGITGTALPLSRAAELTPGDMALLLNVDTEAPAFHSLLRRHAAAAGPMVYPDPFLKLAVAEMTGYKRAVLSGEQVSGLRAIVGGVELKGNREGIFRATLALDAYLRRLGIEEDVFHLHIASQKTPVACYRYDLRGMQIALSYIQDGDSVVARNVPISPDRAVLFRQSRPVYTVFRFMAVAKGGL